MAGRKEPVVAGVRGWLDRFGISARGWSLLTARRSGMKVTQFYMGMGPKVFSFQRGEVEFGLRALPVGAFVRIVGMNNLMIARPKTSPAHIANSLIRRECS